LQASVHAITEYVYDLTDRYEEFKEREEEKKKRRSSNHRLPVPGFGVRVRPTGAMAFYACKKPG
jgi:hypothetical protein